MALTIDLVDYGPLYNAFNAQRNAATLATSQKEIAAGQLGFKAQQQGFSADVLRYQAGQESNNAQLVSSVIQLATDVGKQIYSTMNDAALERTKVKTINLETEYSKRIAQGIYTGQITYDSEGKLQLPDELQAWYKEQSDTLQKGLEGYPQVQAWASGQAAAIQQNGELHALSVASQAATATRAAAQKDTLQMALNKSVAAGSLAPVDAALESFTNVSKEEKTALRSLVEQDFNYRAKEGGIRNLVSAQGYDAGVTQVETWRKSGEVTLEQADALLNQAANQGKVQGAVFAQQSQADYQKMVDAGVDPEAALKMVAKGIPEAYRTQTEELLHASADTAATRADTASHENMQDFYQKNRNDPAALRAYLDLPKNNFSKLMKADTYMYWDRVIDSLTKPPAASQVMTPGEKSAWSVFYNPMKTDTMAGKEIQQLVTAGMLDPSIAPEILSKMSQRKNFINPVVLSAVNVINSTFDLMAEKEKDPTKKSAILFAQRDMLMNLDKYLGEGPRTGPQVRELMAEAMRPYKADILKSDLWNPLTKTEVDATRSRMQKGWAPMDPDQRAALSATYEYQDRVMLERDFGVGKKPGTMVQASEQMDNGLSRFTILGLNPKHPKDAFYYMFQTDPTTGTEQLMVLEEVKNAQGQTIGANWMPASFVKTLTQEGAEAEAVRKRQKAEQEKRIAASVPISSGVAAIKETAAEEGIKPEEAAGVVAKAGPAPNIEQIQTLLIVKGFLRTKRMTEADVEAIAKQVGTTAAAVFIAVRAQGVEVTK